MNKDWRLKRHNISVAVAEIAIDGRLSEKLHHLEGHVRNLGSGSDLKKIRKTLEDLDRIRNLPVKEYVLDGLILVPKTWQGTVVGSSEC